MAKIYNTTTGAKMNLSEICAEVVQIITPEQKKVLADAVNKYEYDNSQMKLAHGILDTYRLIDSTSEQGARIRKLLDNIMTKYQKSTPANADDQAIYHNLIVEINK